MSLDLIEKVHDTSHVDLRTTVLAESVEVKKSESGSLEITFDFLCPNCGKRHWANELRFTDRPLSFLSYQLACGRVKVRLPWAKTPERDSRSVLRRGVV